jgi:pimeloyl-ACP methyl ester carboxylesterase
MKASARVGVGLAVLGAALVFGVGGPLLERLFGRTRLRFPYLARPIAEATYGALAAKPGWAKAEIEVAPGIKLRGLLRRTSSATAPWVLFYPGNDESQLERGQAFLSRLANDADWGLAVFPYRGYDASDGKPELATLREDAPEILAKLCALESIAPARVHLAGFSIGGHFAVHAAGRANKRNRRAASLTLLASVDDIVMFKPSPWEKLSAGEDYQTRPYLADVPAPVLVLQGTADEALAGPGQGRDIAQALGDRGTYQELEGVRHVPLLENASALDAVRAFIRAHAAP